MNTEKNTSHSFQAWVTASRPKTLPAAAAAVVMGSALAWHDSSLQPAAAVVCLLCALLLQIASNLANDVFDFERGADTPDRLGPTRVTQSGILTPRQVKTGLAVVLTLASALGLYLVYLGGLPILLIGAAAAAAAVAYTGGPFPLGYHGLGEIMVFLFFGFASVTGTYYVQTGDVSPASLWLAIPPGAIITAILVVNNLRDLENDRAAGKRTLAVRIGETGTKVEYAALLAAAYAAVPLSVLAGLIPSGSLLSLASFPLAAAGLHRILTVKGRPLNRALALTGQTALVFSVLFWAGLLLFP